MRIFFTILIVIAFTSSFAQVGINTDNPDQALDVDGKVKIGNDGRTPSEGTVRYSATGDFEGYRADGWNSFTEKGSASLPSNPIPVFGSDFGVSPSSSGQLVTFQRFSDLTSFSTVPNDQYLLITSIHIEPNGLNASGNYEITIGRGTGGSIDQLSALRLRGFPESEIYKDPLGIMMIVRPGEELLITNESSSDFGINVKVRGFLVDDLNYN